MFMCMLLSMGQAAGSSRCLSSLADCGDCGPDSRSPSMSSQHHHAVRSSRKTIVMGWLAGWLVRLLSKTLRVRVIDDAGLNGDAGQQKPVIYAMWHNRILVVPPVWKRWCGARRSCVVLTSASRDGEVVERAMAVFGLEAVRGSTSRRGVAALVGLLRVLRQGKDVCITPDGPKGPRYRLQPGVVKLASSASVPLVLIHVRCASAWRLRSWDRFVIPKPFSRVEVRFSGRIELAKGLPDEELELQRQKLERMLVDGVDDA